MQKLLLDDQFNILIRRIDSSFSIDELKEFCIEAGKYWDIMGFNNWENTPAMFLHKLYIEKLYDEKNRGSFYLGTLNNKIICTGGMSKLHDTNYAHVFTRMFTLPQYRKLTQYHYGDTWWQKLTLQMNLDVSGYNYDGYIVSFNDYNRKYHKMIAKSNMPSKIHYEDNVPYVKDRIAIPFYFYPNPVVINHTKQWINFYPKEMKSYLGTIHYDD